MFSPFSYAQLGVSQLTVSQPADMAFVSRAFARLCSHTYGSRAKKSTIDASHLSVAARARKWTRHEHTHIPMAPGGEGGTPIETHPSLNGCIGHE